MTFSRMNLLNDEEHVSNTSAIYQTCKEIYEAFSFFVKPLFPCEVVLRISFS